MPRYIKKFVPVSWHYKLSNLKRSIIGHNTYAQFGEDEVLGELFKDAPPGRYVDVGAHHPYRYSNTYLLYTKGWRGVNIDPNPDAIRLFEKARPGDENICSGVGRAGTLTYYRFSDPAVNTFREAEAREWKQKSFLAFLGESAVAVRPLSELVKDSFDLLSIDAEGMDLEVLESYGWNHYPRVIVIEGTDSAAYLAAKGYRPYAVRGPSTIYTHG